MYKKTLMELKKEWMKNPEFRKEYKRLDPEFKLMELMIEKRIKEGLTQKEIAKKMGTKQSAISRFEVGKGNPTLQFMQKLADALGAKMKITITPR
ncbi:MAG: helix-turn-helix transcriptional regulator [Patescibacteria group bacterium]|mgnify:CR=1 FL=1